MLKEVNERPYTFHCYHDCHPEKPLFMKICVQYLDWKKMIKSFNWHLLSAHQVLERTQGHLDCACRTETTISLLFQNPINVGHTHFTKAFGNIFHYILVSNMQKYGLTGSPANGFGILKWLDEELHSKSAECAWQPIQCSEGMLSSSCQPSTELGARVMK